MSEIKDIPGLRFSSFNDVWKLYGINDLVKDEKGSIKIGPFGSQLKRDSFVTDGFKVFGQENIFINDFDFGDRFISESHFEKLKTNEILKGDFVISTMGTIGKCSIVPELNKRGIMDSHMIRLRLNSHINSDFLIHLFRLQKTLKQIKRLSVGGIMDGLSIGIIKELKFFLPSLPEQQKIADFLTAVDKRIELLEKKKTLLETYKKGVMKEIFNREVRFKDDNGNDFPDWEEMRLGDITNKKSSNISANSIEQIEGDFIVYGATGELKKIDYYEMDRPYISIVKDGSGVGRVNMCKPFSSVLGTLDILTNNELSDLDFVFQFLSKTSFLKYITGSSIPHIYYKDYSKLKMLVPTVEEQVKISKFLSSIDNQIEILKTQIDKSKTWKKGLLQKMFV